MPWEHHRLVHSGLGSSTSWSSRLASVVEHMLTAYRNFLRVFPFSFMTKPVQFSIQSILISIQCSPKLFFKITPRFSEMWVVPFSFNFVQERKKLFSTWLKIMYTETENQYLFYFSSYSKMRQTSENVQKDRQHCSTVCDLNPSPS